MIKQRDLLLITKLKEIKYNKIFYYALITILYKYRNA